MIESIATYKINSFDNLQKKLCEKNNLQGYIFRGHQNSKWELKPSFFRNSSITETNSSILLQRHLEKFKIFIRGRVSNIKNMSEDEIWSIGQHYGLLTPLLDWTASPYIALFFATKSCNTDKADHCLYALNTKLINKQINTSISKIIDTDKSLMAVFDNRYDFSDFSNDEKNIVLGSIITDSVLNSDELPTEAKNMIQKIILENISIVNPKIDNNPRLLTQRGLFTKTNTIDSLDKIIENISYSSNDIVLYKYVFSDDLSIEIKEILNSMNINDLSLFPDLEGTANYCNYKLLKEASLNLKDIKRINIENIWI
jgi:hypothetical protein